MERPAGSMPYLWWRMIRLLVLATLAVGVVGCGNPYLDPQTSKAVSERDQLRESEKQTALMERQTIALEKIAERCGR